LLIPCSLATGIVKVKEFFIMIKILKRVTLNSPIFLPCWPGMGEVAIKAGLFLKEALSFKPFARLQNSGFFEPQAITTRKGIVGLPRIEEGTFYYCKRPLPQKDLILFLAEAQPPMEKAHQLGKLIIDYVATLKVSRIFTFAAFPQPIEHTQGSSVWVTATDRQTLDELSKYNIKVLDEGQISGLNGLILGLAKERRIKGACFLGEIPFYTIQIENPKSTLAVLEVLANYLKLSFDFKPLEERTVFLEEEINKLISYLKGDTSAHEPLPLSEADVQKIKKDLESFTKLPHSARGKIEELFREASRNLSFASELKKTLDEWGVYKDYEDRFLDLFKKKRFDH